jgi:hypothetical protein
VGGRPLVLTCKDCNDRAGHQLDVHWGNLSDVEAFLRSELKDPVTAWMVYGDAKTTIELSSVDRNVVSKVIKRASSPKAIETQESILRAAAPMPDGLTFRVTLHKSRYSEKRARVSMLRAAYLAVFSVTGYRLLPRWKRIRDQIAKPAAVGDWVMRLTRHDHDLLPDRRQFVEFRRPMELACYYIGFGRWTAVIPWRDDSPLYGAPPPTGWDLDEGQAYEWPVEPSFGLPSDWDSGSPM